MRNIEIADVCRVANSHANYIEVDAYVDNVRMKFQFSAANWDAYMWETGLEDDDAAEDFVRQELRK